MFFTAIHQMMTEGVDLTLVIRKANGRIIRQAVLPQAVQTPVRPAAMAKALNQPAVLPARTILATALNRPRIDWLGC